jgi:hypothetical protein
MLKTFFLAGGLIILVRLVISKNQNFENTVTNVKSEFYRFIYNCIYYYSVCQLKYRKLSCYVNPYLHYIYSSESQYCQKKCYSLKDNSIQENKNSIWISFYNNTALIKNSIYNYDSSCEALDLNLFIKNEEPMNHNLIVMSLLSKQIEKNAQQENIQHDKIIKGRKTSIKRKSILSVRKDRFNVI